MADIEYVDTNYSLDQSEGVPKKRALIIGCNYRGTKGELRNCINDARAYRRLAIDTYAFPEENICYMVDNGESDRIPTYVNIIAAMQWLVDGVNAGDTLFFVFSGHGSRMHADADLQHFVEADGYDEYIVPASNPLQMQDQRCVTDNEMHSIMAAVLRKGARLTCVIDACRSGTALDLLYGLEGRADGVEKLGTGHVFLISGCRDDEFSSDGGSGGAGGRPRNGAMTTALLQALQRGPRASLANVMLRLYDAFPPYLQQHPQLSSAHDVSFEKHRFL